MTNGSPDLLSALAHATQVLLENDIARLSEELKRGTHDRSAAPGTNRYVQLTHRLHDAHSALERLKISSQ